MTSFWSKHTWFRRTISTLAIALTVCIQASLASLIAVALPQDCAPTWCWWKVTPAAIFWPPGASMESGSEEWRSIGVPTAHAWSKNAAKMQPCSHRLDEEPIFALQ